MMRLRDLMTIIDVISTIFESNEIGVYVEKHPEKKKDILKNALKYFGGELNWYADTDLEFEDIILQSTRVMIRRLYEDIKKEEYVG